MSALQMVAGDFDKAFAIAIDDVASEESSAPIDLANGISLNNDGGNNAYLITTGGSAILGGRTALTLETTFAMSTNNSNTNTLLSYVITGPVDEVQLRVLPTGQINFGINGTLVNSGAITQLLDGKAHHIAVSWDNTAGDVRIYADGQLVYTATGIRAGYTIGSGGTLTLGQDQDSVDGTYDATQNFSGTVYDVRVWDSAISDEQIAGNYQQVPGASETGLVANWRMAGLVSGTTVTEAVAGRNFTVSHVAVGGLSRRAP